MHGNTNYNLFGCMYYLYQCCTVKQISIIIIWTRYGPMLKPIILSKFYFITFYLVYIYNMPVKILCHNVSFRFNAAVCLRITFFLDMALRH